MGSRYTGGLSTHIEGQPNIPLLSNSLPPHIPYLRARSHHHPGRHADVQRSSSQPPVCHTSEASPTKPKKLDLPPQALKITNLDSRFKTNPQCHVLIANQPSPTNTKNTYSGVAL